MNYHLAEYTMDPSPDTLQCYLRDIAQLPMLSEMEEQTLALQFKTTGDLQAAQKLVLSHLRYVVSIARNYQGYGLALTDLIQEGTIGLMKAVKRFEPQKQVRLATYALVWIKSAIHDFIIQNWRIVKVATTKAQRKLFFNLRSKKQTLNWLTIDEQSMLAQDLQVPLQEVAEMESRLYAQDVSFDLPDTEDESYAWAPAQTLIGHASQEPLTQLLQADKAALSKTIATALETLDPRSQRIIEARWLTENGTTTLKDLSIEFGISLERVRQLEQAAFKKLQLLLAA
jgi:RNA polymerase sigma-32 factor